MVGRKGLIFESAFLGTNSISPGLQIRIFLQIPRTHHFLHVDDPGFGPLIRYAPEKKHLRVLGGVGEASGDGDCLRKGDVAAPVKFSRFPNLAAHNEVRFLEILGIDRDHRVLKDFGVGRS